MVNTGPSAGCATAGSCTGGASRVSPDGNGEQKGEDAAQEAPYGLLGRPQGQMS